MCAALQDEGEEDKGEEADVSTHRGGAQRPTSSLEAKLEQASMEFEATNPQAQAEAAAQAQAEAEAQEAERKRETERKAALQAKVAAIQPGKPGARALSVCMFGPVHGCSLRRRNGSLGSHCATA